MLTREVACVRKAFSVVKVSREEISVRLQYCSLLVGKLSNKINLNVFLYVYSYMEFMSVDSGH